jgi:hypothetical protein
MDTDHEAFAGIMAFCVAMGILAAFGECIRRRLPKKCQQYLSYCLRVISNEEVRGIVNSSTAVACNEIVAHSDTCHANTKLEETKSEEGIVSLKEVLGFATSTL